MTCKAKDDLPFAEQLENAINYLNMPNLELTKNLKNIVSVDEIEQKSRESLGMIALSSLSLSDYEISKSMRNHSYTIYKNDLYYRNNNYLVPVKTDGRKNGEPNIKTENSIKRIKYLIEIRDKTREILDMQVNGCTDEALKSRQLELENIYENFANNKELKVRTSDNRITNSANRTAFKHDCTHCTFSTEQCQKHKNVRVH